MADEQEQLLVRVNTFLFVVFGIFALLRLPRAFALFRTKDWFQGHLLGFRKPVPQNTSEKFFVNDGSSHSDKSPPPHIAACPRSLRFLLTPLRTRIVPGFSGAQLVVVIAYAYLIAYASCYRSNIFTDPERTGWVAISQLPLVFALAQKANFLSTVLGYGYEKLNFLHRFAALGVVITANLHSLVFFYKRNLNNTLGAAMKRPSNQWGLVATICFNMLFFFSISFFRNKSYNVFKYAHIIGFTLVLPASYLHKPSTGPYVFACIAIYALDRLTRIFKTRTRTAIIQPVPELDLTRLEVPSINSGWRAGQHVRIRVLSTHMGWLGWSEVHPFTIASISGGGGCEDGLVLFVKKAGGWTNKLYDLAKTRQANSSFTRVRVMLEGPYGGPGHTIMTSFSAAVFVVGGSGITFALSSIEDIIEKNHSGQSRVRSIDLVWTVPNPGCLIPILPDLTYLISRASTPSSLGLPSSLRLRISVYYTRAPIGKFPFKPDDEAFVDGLTLAPGRPKIERVLESAIVYVRDLPMTDNIRHNAAAKERLCGLVVGVCGPAGLADSVVGAVSAVDAVRKDEVGGVEIVEEVFGW